MLNAGKCEPFIRHIRFPLFRNLRPGLQIDFTHPVTALVGPNGTNKTAILRALQGCPDYVDLGNYWYSTSMDPIAAGEGTSHRFIHGYIAPSSGELVESIKARIARRGDPDYFEPSRPILRDGMQKMPDIVPGEPLPPERTQTRWKAVVKPVRYLDFRSELSAYDKYFFHAPAERGSRANPKPSLIATLTIKKNLIRRRSPHLLTSLQTGRARHRYYARERIVESGRFLDTVQVETISEILGKRYESVQLVTHRYFGVEGATVLLRSFDLTYSEAFAGSGEFAVVMLVVKVMEAPSRSLILLDEPEVSLHPGAQRKLMAFVAEQAKLKGHQVVLSTHSPDIIRALPPNAIKVFYVNETDGKVELLSQASDPAEAFFRLGARIPRSKTVYVEDGLAAAIVRRALRQLGQAHFQQLSIVPLPGGTNTIQTRFIPSFALSGTANGLVLLDGDQRPSEPIPHPDTVSDQDLDTVVTSLMHGKVQLSPDGADGRSSEGARLTQLRAVLRWVHTNVDYLPGASPEELLLALESPQVINEDAKLIWATRTQTALGRGDWESPTAAEILGEQERVLARVAPETPELQWVGDRIRRFLADDSE
jgi:hypothetical protein